MASHPGWSPKSLGCHKQLFLILPLSDYPAPSIPVSYILPFIYTEPTKTSCCFKHRFIEMHPSNSWVIAYAGSAALRPWLHRRLLHWITRTMSYIQTSVFLPSSLTNLSLPYLLSFFWLGVITHLPWLCGAAVSEALFHLPSTFLVPSPLKIQIWTFWGCLMNNESAWSNHTKAVVQLS